MKIRIGRRTGAWHAGITNARIGRRYGRGTVCAIRVLGGVTWILFQISEGLQLPCQVKAKLRLKDAGR